MVKQRTFMRLTVAAVSTSLALLALILGMQCTAAAQGDAPVTTSAGETQVITYTVVAGDTLGRLARRFDTTVRDLVAWNDIANPDLIWVGQVLTVTAPAGWTPTLPSALATATPSPTPGGPLTLSWSLVDWRPDGANYLGTISVAARGGTPPYAYYHDGLPQAGDTFEFAWRRCVPKPGSVGVTDATSAVAHEDYWLPAPYCPVGVEIVEPVEGAELKHMPRHFNLTWRHTVDPPPSAYGIEIEVWERGTWRPWKQYVHQRGDRELFFVPDPFPGDLAGRVRMWGIYDKHEATAKTPWRYFSFRVTY